MKERFQNGIVADLLMIKNEDGKKKILCYTSGRNCIGG